MFLEPVVQEGDNGGGFAEGASLGKLLSLGSERVVLIDWAGLIVWI